MPVEILLRMAFDSGYGAAADYAPSGELLAEAEALQYAFYDLDGKTRRAVALDDLVMAAQVETIEHEEGCWCGLCRAPEAVGGGGVHGSMQETPASGSTAEAA